MHPMSTELNVITTEALHQTECVMGEQAWLPLLHDRKSGLNLISQMRHTIYPKIFNFLSSDYLYGFEGQKEIFKNCWNTVSKAVSLHTFLNQAYAEYQKRDLNFFCTQLKNGRPNTKDICFTTSTVALCLENHLFSLAFNSSRIRTLDATLSDEDHKHNNLAFQFEAQRLMLLIYENWVLSNLSKTLEHAQLYSNVVQDSALGAFKTSNPTTLAQRVAFQRNPNSATAGDDFKNTRGAPAVL